MHLYQISNTTIGPQSLVYHRNTRASNRHKSRNQKMNLYLKSHGRRLRGDSKLLLETGIETTLMGKGNLFSNPPRVLHTQEVQARSMRVRKRTKT